MPKIHFLEAVSHEGIRYEKDDICTVDDDLANLACEHGWAEDTEGKIKTGERSTVPKVLEVKPLAHKPTVKKI